jgi:uncharacterized membrane protein
MQDQLKEIWDRAKAHYSAHLTDRERLSVDKVTSQEELFLHLEGLRVTYSAQVIAKSLTKTHALIAQLRLFTQIINIFVQTSDIAALVWGPLALILEVILSYSKIRAIMFPSVPCFAHTSNISIF